MELSPETARKLLHEAGAEDVEDEAAHELAKLLDLFAGHLSEEAVALVEDDSRTVVQQDDIQQALE